MPGPEPTLGEALAAADAAAQGGDVDALGDAVRRCVELCARMDAAGAAPPARELGELARMHRRVLERAQAVHDQLGQALERAGRSRRATSAYSRR